MYSDDLTFDEPFDFDTFEDPGLEALVLARGRVPAYWDADQAHLVHGDDPGGPEPALGGWEDPEQAAQVLEHTVVEDARLMPLAETPTGRPRLEAVADLLGADPDQAPEEELLALIEDQLGTDPDLAEGVAA